MNAWRKEPPTYQEWRECSNNGYWWIKFLLMEEEIEEDEDGEVGVWPEAWYTEVVQITASYDDPSDMFDPDKPGKLHAKGILWHDHFDLDDPKVTKNMYWQPVVGPLDDHKDKRPEC